MFVSPSSLSIFKSSGADISDVLSCCCFVSTDLFSCVVFSVNQVLISFLIVTLYLNQNLFLLVEQVNLSTFRFMTVNVFKLSVSVRH